METFYQIMIVTTGFWMLLVIWLAHRLTTLVFEAIRGAWCSRQRHVRSKTIGHSRSPQYSEQKGPVSYWPATKQKLSTSGSTHPSSIGKSAQLSAMKRLS